MKPFVIATVLFGLLACLPLAQAQNQPSTKNPDRPAKAANAKANAKAKAKPQRQASVGPAIGSNTSTPIELIKALPGFKVELLYSVPGQDQGSWVNLCTDGKGRLLVSDQFGGLYRITPPAAGTPLSPADVQPVPADIRAVNGMLWHNDSLYVGVNDYEGKIPSGLYRLSDSDGDDNLDKVELLRELEARGDHGIHAVLPTPDGKSLYLVCGNATKATPLAATSQVPQVWGEDHLLPRMPDGRGFMRDVLGPGGKIFRVSLDGKSFEAFAVGFRNIFDAAINRDGELFTYDADMEYDFNTSWYRPTRINHVVSGGEYGWRNGAGKRPEFYADNLPATLNIGPGSPTGVTFGYGAKFPAKYQNALFALDWSWGKLYAVHLEPSASTYRASKEEFLTGAPLPITDAIIHPADGAMYFTIGGRRVQSGLYRVTYTGSEPTTPAPQAATASAARDLRHKLESFHGRQDAAAVETAWQHLDSPDRFIRWAARTAIEHQPLSDWSQRALGESDPARQVEALLALARVAGVCPQHRTPETPPVNGSMRDQLLNALMEIEPASLDHERRLTWLRTIEIALNRFGPVDDARVASMVAKLDPLFPAPTREENWLLCETLVYLQSPQVAAKAMALIAKAPSQEEQIEYGRSLRMLREGWTPETHNAYFEWLLRASNYRGGASFQKFIEFIRNDAIESLDEEDKKVLAEVLAKKPVSKTPLETMNEAFAGRTAKEWSLEELSALAKSQLHDRNFENGRKMFGAAACYSCHRFANEGGMTGPDLTAAGARYSPHDLIDQIINPSRVINEQFSSVVALTDDGQVHTGVVVNLNGDTLTLNTDLTDPDKRVTLDRKGIESLEMSKVSAMPAGLLGLLTPEEILDLLAYVISGGNAEHRLFKK
ncbi:MAG: c-type cytochrome [Planctomycetaceae bacterium]